MATPDPAKSADFWPVFQAYESGKSRRYGHLFAVNGGAFAVMGFLLPRYGGGDGPAAVLFGAWAFVMIPALLGWFAWGMCRDIDSFGRGMQVMAGWPEDAELDRGIYRADGRRLLAQVQVIFVSTWAVAAAVGIVDTLSRLGVWPGEPAGNWIFAKRQFRGSVGGAGQRRAVPRRVWRQSGGGFVQVLQIGGGPLSAFAQPAPTLTTALVDDEPAPIPLPAGLPMLAAALGLLGLAAGRRVLAR